ncbi:hypothetical protein V1387_15465 [Allomuricauda taeanensis]|nr:hypothetical protein [Allomuricauda taeanensis]MEE1964090.1 hypothetical protein [Allomuricauda taeanensis]
MRRSWKCFGYDLTDAEVGLTDDGFGLMGKVAGGADFGLKVKG